MRGSILFMMLLGVAAAQPELDAEAKNARIEELAEQAAEHYAAGKFREAVDDYRQAYEIEPFGPVLYNIAYILDRELDDAVLAKDYYRRYISAPDAEAKTLATAKERLAAIEEKLAMTPVAPVKEPVVEPSLATQPVPAPIVVTSASTQRIVGWTLIGVGALAAGGGAAMGFVAASTHDDFEQTDDARERGRLRDEGEQQALLGDIAMGVGAAALIAGVIVVLTDAEPELAPALSVSSDSASLSWRIDW